MECRAKITNLAKSLSGDLTVTLELKEVSLEKLMKLSGIDLVLGLKKYYEKRGLNANAYFHVLVNKIAEVVERSPAYVKNDLIAECGYKEMLGDVPAVIKTNLGPEVMMEQEILHTRVVKVEDDVCFYYVYRGSHTYNTKEMSRLIDIAVMRAQEVGIETKTPEQIERMKRDWEEYVRREKSQKKKTAASSAEE